MGRRKIVTALQFVMGNLHFGLWNALSNTSRYLTESLTINSHKQTLLTSNYLHQKGHIQKSILSFSFIIYPDPAIFRSVCLTSSFESFSTDSCSSVGHRLWNCLFSRFSVSFHTHLSTLQGHSNTSDLVTNWRWVMLNLFLNVPLSESDPSIGVSGEYRCSDRNDTGRIQIESIPCWDA